MVLHVRNIALDTQFIVSQNFLKGSLITELGNQGFQGHINIYLTDIVLREVLNQFKMSLLAAKDINLGRHVKKMYVLKNFTAYDIYFNFPEINVDELHRKFSLEFSEWMDRCNVTTIKTDGIQIGKVFDDYFSLLPPFEERKKHEFPDAFTLAALEAFFVESGEKCIFLSGDSGVNNYKSELLITNITANEVIGNIVRAFNNDKIPFLEGKFKEYLDVILKMCEEPIYKEVERAILDAYTIDGRLIDGFDFLNVQIVKTQGFDIIHADERKFGILFGVNLIVKANIRLLSTALSTWGSPRMVHYPDEVGRVEINKEELTDIFIRGIFDISSKVFELTDVSVSPVEIIDEARKRY